MKYQVLCTLKNDGKEFIYVLSAFVIGALRVKRARMKIIEFSKQHRFR